MTWDFIASIAYSQVGVTHDTLWWGLSGSKCDFYPPISHPYTIADVTAAELFKAIIFKIVSKAQMCAHRNPEVVSL